MVTLVTVFSKYYGKKTRITMQFLVISGSFICAFGVHCSAISLHVVYFFTLKFHVVKLICPLHIWRKFEISMCMRQFFRFVLQQGIILY